MSSGVFKLLIQKPSKELNDDAVKMLIAVYDPLS
jgi:hypothetical protein